MFRTIIVGIALLVLMLSCGGSERGGSGDLSDADSLYADSCG